MTWKNYNKKSKFHNEPVTVDGIRYDSRNEARRHAFLKLMEKAGEISELQYHVPFTLIPKGSVEIIRMPDGTEIETKRYDRKHWYEADFVYTTKKGDIVVEDFKGFETESFKQKRELFKIIYKKDITIVKQINQVTF
jgi:hypothetical protein